MRGDNNYSRNFDFEEVTLAVSARMKSAMDIIANRYHLSQKYSSSVPHDTVSSGMLSNSPSQFELSSYADPKRENDGSYVKVIRLPRNNRFHNGW